MYIINRNKSNTDLQSIDRSVSQPINQKIKALNLRILSRSFFQSISQPDSCLHHLFPPLRDTSVISRLYGPPLLTLVAHPHALKYQSFINFALHLIITSRLLLLRFTSSYNYSLHPSYSPVQYYSIDVILYYCYSIVWLSKRDKKYKITLLLMYIFFPFYSSSIYL